MAAPTKNDSKALKEKCRMITPEFRVSYPHVFKAQAPKPNDKKKYSVTMLFPKGKELVGDYLGGAGKVSLKEVMRLAKLAEFGPKENWPDDLESPVIDGDDPKFADKEGYKGHWVIKASTSEDNRPGLVDRRGVPITTESDFYPGCYAKAYVYCYIWFYPDRQKPMKKGIGFILDHVQKTKDGDSFGGKKPVDQVFAPIDDGGDDDTAEESSMDFT